MAQWAVNENELENNEALPKRPIDRAHLAKQCLGDPNLELEILRLFDTTIKTYYERLRLAADYDGMAMNLHAIKGASAGVGAFEVTELARQLERDLQGMRPLTTEQLDDLGMAVEEVRATIADILSEVE